MVEFDIDNRDLETTWIVIKNPSDLPDPFMFEVNPWNLVKDAIANLPFDEVLMKHFLGKVDELHEEVNDVLADVAG